MRRVGDSWPQPMRDSLAALISTGASYREIAIALHKQFPDEPKKSRSAIIGKADRMGIRSDKPAASKGGMPKQPRSAPFRRPASRTAVSAGLPPVTFRDAPATLRAVNSPLSLASEKKRYSADQIVERKKGYLRDIVESNPLTSRPVAECDKGTCQWPTSNDIRCMEVCGAAAMIGAYCERHAKVAYRVMPTIKRNRTFGKNDVEYKSIGLDQPFRRSTDADIDALLSRIAVDGI